MPASDSAYGVPYGRGGGKGGGGRNEDGTPANPRAIATAQPLALDSQPDRQTDPQSQNAHWLYLSYDDSASTAGVELTKLALSLDKKPSPSWARSWEFLNRETFDQSRLKPVGLFRASMGLWPAAENQEQAFGTTDETKVTSPKQTPQSLYQLGVQVASPELDRQQRKNLVLTVVVDVSASMFAASYQGPQGPSPQSRLELVRRGLKEMYASLKPGDQVNLVEFSFNAVPTLENHLVGEQSEAYFEAVERLGYVSATNLESGLQEAYRLALKAYDPGKINRVVLLTDAQANVGEVNARLLSEHTRIHQQEGIYFSGIGVGEEFQEAFLNTLTEAGRGSYFLMATAADAQRIFSERFMALINVAGRNVRFRLDYPKSFKHTDSAAEELSTVPSKIQPIHFSYNTSQYFLESFAGSGQPSGSEKFRLTINYQDPLTDESREEVLEQSLSDLLGQDLDNIQSAYAINLLTELLSGSQSPEQLLKSKARITRDTPLIREYQGLLDKALKLLVPGGLP